MKDAMEVLLTRRSIRNFNDKGIPEDVLNKILEAGTYAPTAMGMQKPIIIAITDKKVRDEVVARKCENNGQRRSRSVLRRARNSSRCG